MRSWWSYRTASASLYEQRQPLTHPQSAEACIARKRCHPDRAGSRNSWLFVGDAPFARALHQADVLRQCSAVRLERWLFPRGSAGLKLSVADLHVDQVPLGIDDDAVAAADQGDRSALLRFRRHVT